MPTQKPFISVNRSELDLIREAQALESTGALSEIEVKRLTLAVRHRLGSQASTRTFLVERAKTLLQASHLNEVNGRLKAPHWHLARWTCVLMLVAFVLGAFFDQLASAQHTINLLAPSVLCLLLWNVLIYGVLFFETLFRQNKSKKSPKSWFGSPRSLLTHLIENSRLPSLKTTKAHARYLAQCREDFAPLLQTAAARAFHAGALAFALGLIVSTLVKGIGTHWMVGWESTWFAAAPLHVHSLLTLLYGWLPFIGPIPNVETIAHLEFGTRTFANAQAPLWVARLLELLALIIVLPRALLVGVLSLKLRHQNRHYPIALDTPYFKRLLTNGPQTASVLCLIANNTLEAWKTLTQTLKTAFDPQAHIERLDIWSLNIDVFREAHQSEMGKHVLVCLSGVQTPEHDVHGVFLKAASELTKALSSTPTVFVNIENVDPLQRVSREALWRTFAGHYGFSVQFLELNTLNTALAMSSLEKVLG